jgi:hypothetical protein
MSTVRQSCPPDLLRKLCHVFLTSTQLMHSNKSVAHDPHAPHMQSDHSHQPSRPLTCKDMGRQRLSSAGSKEVQHRTQHMTNRATEFPSAVPHGLACSLPTPVPSRPNSTDTYLPPGPIMAIHGSGLHVYQAKTDTFKSVI